MLSIKGLKIVILSGAKRSEESLMWEIEEPNPVKLIIAVMAADDECLSAALDALVAEFGKTDLVSDVWPFDQTDYYKDQTGPHIVKQFVSIDKLIDPGELAQIKHKTNQIEQRLAEILHYSGIVWPRPINLDPGIIEPSKLVLASTKNFSHRIYIGGQMYAEVTLVFHKGKWESFPYTFPDYKQLRYLEFFNKVRTRLVEQLRKTQRL
jgi:hypothetical protein